MHGLGLLCLGKELAELIWAIKAVRTSGKSSISTPNHRMYLNRTIVIFFFFILHFPCKLGGSLITTRHVLTSARYLDRTLYVLNDYNSFLYKKLEYWWKKNRFIFRNFVRLGEFNSREVIDGKFVDIDIVRQELHEKWNANLKINDIAIVYLAHDVIFTGNWINNSKETSIDSILMISIQNS